MWIHPGYSYYLVTALKFIQSILDGVLDFVFGYTTKNGWRSERVRSYDKAAQLVNIRYKGALTPMFKHHLKNFLYTHERYVSPEYVLRHDNVTLQLCTETEAVFCVTDPSENIYDMPKHPFVCLSQWLECKQLVIVPFWALHKLADDLGDPPENVNIIGIGMSARSGSTLLTQMFNKVPRTVAMSEPWALVHAHEWFNRGIISKEEYPRLLRSLLRLQFKPIHNVEYDRMVMKLSIYLNAAVGIFSEVFPKMKLIYSTRSPSATMPSYFCNMQSPLFSLSLKHKEWQEANFQCTCFDYDDERLQKLRLKLHDENKDLDVPNYPSDMGYLYAAAVLVYLKYKKLYKCCVLYEDLLADPVKETTKMFEAVNVPTEHVSRALTALERHSQNHVFGDPNVIKYKKLTKEQLDEVKKAFKNMKTPFDLDISVDEYRRLVKTN